MNVFGAIKSFLSRISTFYLILLAISPLILSLIIHLLFLFYANNVIWSWPRVNTAFFEEPLVDTILKEGRANDLLKFQGTYKLDDFDADDNLSDPVPEIEYRPIIPTVDILPSPKAN